MALCTVSIGDASQLTLEPTWKSRSLRSFRGQYGQHNAGLGFQRNSVYMPNYYARRFGDRLLWPSTKYPPPAFDEVNEVWKRFSLVRQLPLKHKSGGSPITLTPPHRTARGSHGVLPVALVCITGTCRSMQSGR